MKLNKLGIIVAGTLVVSAISQGVVAQTDAGQPDAFSLWQEVQALQDQVRQQNGQIELLQHQINENKRHRQALYEDIDERLSKLEPKDKSSADDDSQNNSGDFSDTESTEQEQSAQEAYKAAYEMLKDNQYGNAIDQFKEFIKQYPKSKYVPNAWYWLGQALYVEGDQERSFKALTQVAEHYSDSNKMPSTLFRMGVIKRGEGDDALAEKLFKKVIEDYPDSKSADMARQQL